MSVRVEKRKVKGDRQSDGRSNATKYLSRESCLYDKPLSFVHVVSRTDSIYGEVTKTFTL